MLRYVVVLTAVGAPFFAAHEGLLVCFWYGVRLLSSREKGRLVTKDAQRRNSGPGDRVDFVCAGNSRTWYELILPRPGHI
jgi:hypothetical protein